MIIVIPIRITESFHTAISGAPWIIIFLMASIYQRAGIIFDTTWKNRGKFSMGNSSPDNIIIGIIITIAEISSAAIWVCAIVETKSPNESDNTK